MLDGTEPRWTRSLCAIAMGLAALGMSPDTAAAQAANDPCKGVPGTYVTTITDIEGVFASRGIMTFGSGGTLVVSDSRQGGKPGVYKPFSTGQGAWRCTDGSITAVAFTFTLAISRARSTFGRVDYTATVIPETGDLIGEIALRFTPEEDLEDADPTTDPGNVFEEFGFEGKRLSLK